jgi:hypothetical protein
MKFYRLAFACGVAPCALLVAWASGCGAAGNPLTLSDSGGAGGTGSGTGNGSGTGTGTGDTSGMGGTILQTGPSGSGGSPAACSGLECQIHACSGGGSTKISGKIYDPAGKNGLYSIVAYVPNKPPSAFTSGASCYTCSDLYTGDPIASAVTDPTGSFTIDKAPDGANIPLVIQVGKWRRQFVIPSVTMCGDTTLPDGTLTLPKNGTEGDLPEIAISTGSADTLECLLVRVGVDPSEYTPGPGGTGHIHIFQGDQQDNGEPNTMPSAPYAPQALWDSAGDINKYDIVMLSCEGKETLNMNQQVLFDYAKGGGRVFGSHYHYAWFNTGPFGSANLATWMTGSGNLNNISAKPVTTTWAGAPFQRGEDFAAWLGNVDALTNGELPIVAARQNSNVTMSNTPSQPWLVADQSSGANGWSQDFTFDTPLGTPAAMQCGRVAYSDMHVSGATNDYPGSGGGGHMGGGGQKITPTGCVTGDLSPQEKALEFILFDLSSCVTANNTVMMPPPPPMTM